jgi:hypothetical protein
VFVSFNVWEIAPETTPLNQEIHHFPVVISNIKHIDRYPSSLEDGNTTVTLPTVTTTTNSTIISGLVTQEIVAASGFILLGLVAVAILFSRKRDTA